MDKRMLGQSGEEMATQMLEAKGYRILERNYRCRFGEVDIIAEAEGILVFVEVKARSSTGFGRPAEAVTKQKLWRMERSAKCYTVYHGIGDVSIRFDVVEIFCANTRSKLFHWEGVM